MPKKFSTAENPKSIASRERKKALQSEKVTQKLQAEEDAQWQDKDKHVLKKQQRKEEQIKKHEQQLIKKSEKKQLLDKEINLLKPAKDEKLTRSQIDANLKNKIQPRRKEEESVQKLEKNLNKMKIEGVARNVNEAIAVLSEKPTKDKHPEKRRKAAFAEYEDRRLKELRMLKPELRLSQLKEIIFKEWQKSPENPLNQI